MIKDCERESDISIYHTCYSIINQKKYLNIKQYSTECKKLNSTIPDYPMLNNIFVRFFISYIVNPIISDRSHKITDWHYSVIPLCNKKYFENIFFFKFTVFRFMLKKSRS